MTIRISLLVLTALMSATTAGVSQEPQLPRDEKKAVIDSVCARLEAEYMFPDVSERYIQSLKENLRSGKYDELRSPAEFASRITADLAAVQLDKHLVVRYDPDWVQEKREQSELDEAAVRRRDRQGRMQNYGFEELKILPGNIGYLKLQMFSYDSASSPVAVAAMNFLANTDALIIDLRTNGGGSPEMVQLLCSYLLENPRKLLNSFYYRDKEKTTQYWTYTYLPGKRLTKADIYLLTSRNTFSAAEEFTYNLKNMKRATVVGEVTGGGAHDNKLIVLTDRFMMSLPFARAENPVTHTNWEGVGVEPDVKVPSARALDTARVLAIHRLSESESDPRFQSYYSWVREGYEALANPVAIDTAVLASYAGIYGPRTLTLENGSLYYQRDHQSKMKMIPVSSDSFMFNEVDYFRLRILHKNGTVHGVEGYTAEGPTDRHMKER